MLTFFGSVRVKCQNKLMLVLSSHSETILSSEGLTHLLAFFSLLFCYSVVQIGIPVISRHEI